MSIERTVSPTLSNLIAEANYTLQNASEKILAVYNYAVENDGFTPVEARQLVENKIVNVTSRYIRKVLPTEAKRTYTTQIGTAVPKLDKTQESDEKVVNIPTNYEVKDAEPSPEEEEEKELIDLPEPPHRRQEEEQKEIVRLRHQIEDLTNENTQLRIQKIGTLSNKFDFEYDFEMPSGSIVPFIVTVFPDKKDGYLRLNKEKVAEIQRKESRNKK